MNNHLSWAIDVGRRCDSFGSCRGRLRSHGARRLYIAGDC
jgi:hypothetical protein